MIKITKLFVLIVTILTAPLVPAQQDRAALDESIKQAKNTLADGQLSRALSRYEALAGQHPESSDIMEGLGSAQLLNQKYQDAVVSYQNAVRLGETSGRSFMGMGMAYIHLGMFTTAEAALKEARKRQHTPNPNLDRVINWLKNRQGHEFEEE